MSFQFNKYKKRVSLSPIETVKVIPLFDRIFILSYDPFTTRYIRNDLRRYETTDKCNHCNTWDSGNGR